MRVVVPSKGRPSSYDLVAYMNTIAASNPSFLPSTTTTAALSSLITWSCLEKFRYVVRVNQKDFEQWSIISTYDLNHW